MNIVEAYIGEYASGKSETAINRAIELAEVGQPVTLVDLDTVEPCYTLRPLKRLLEAKGIVVLAWETNELIGLGETGNLMRGDMRWALRRPGNIIMDIGYGVHGARTLNLVEDSWTSSLLRVLAVINVARPLTSTVAEITEYVGELGRVDALINNSHLGDDTDLEIIMEGAEKVTAAARVLGLPVEATIVEERFKDGVGNFDNFGNKVRFIKRYMPECMW